MVSMANTVQGKTSPLRGVPKHQRRFKRDEHGLLLQICWRCETPKYLPDFHIRYQEKDEPYNRDSVCIECNKPYWKRQGQNRRDELRMQGLSSRKRPLGLKKSYPWFERNNSFQSG